MRRIFTWKLTGAMPPKMNPAEVLATIRHALHEWEKVCYVGFVQDAGTGAETDIEFRFGTVSRKNFTGERLKVGNKHVITFNHLLPFMTFKPGPWGWLSRIWQFGKDMLTFTLHESGHVLGLPHVEPDDDQFSVMHPYPEAGGYVTKPSRGDAILAAQLFPFPK